MKNNPSSQFETFLAYCYFQLDTSTWKSPNHFLHTQAVLWQNPADITCTGKEHYGVGFPLSAFSELQDHGIDFNISSVFLHSLCSSLGVDPLIWGSPVWPKYLCFSSRAMCTRDNSEAAPKSHCRASPLAGDGMRWVLIPTQPIPRFFALSFFFSLHKPADGTPRK